MQQVDVAYSPPEIDTQQPAQARRIENVEILEVPYPNTQDIRNAMPMFPGVVRDTAGRLHFNGGAADQTNYTLDGFNITDPVTGRFEANMNVESVRAMDLETAGFAADKGRGSAGNVDLKTEMGNDQWRFGATSFVPSLSSSSGLHFNKWTPRVKVSGPIAKGRAWFHNGFDSFYDVDTIPELPRSENRSRALSVNNLTRAQVNITPANIFTASLLYNHATDRSRGLTVLDPLETTINRRANLLFGSFRNQWTTHGGVVVELGFGATRSYSRDNPQGDATFEILPEGKRGNYFVDITLEVTRQEWIAKTYLPSLTSPVGNHQLTFGVNLQRSTFSQAADRHEYRVLRRDMSVARAVTFAGSGAFDRRNFEITEYINDRWTPRDDLLVEGGVRIDWDQVVRDVLFSPRLSAAYAPNWARGTKISGSIGIFYDALNLGTITRHQDQVAIATFFNPDGEMTRGPVETGFRVDDRELSVPRFRTFSLGLERRMPLGFHARASYVRRTGSRGLNYFAGVEEQAAPGLSWVREAEYFWLRNWRNDRYDSLELTLRRTFANQFEWLISYMRSSARSDAVVDFSLENPIFGSQGPGPFAWDAPHRILTWGWAPTPNRILPSKLRWLTRDTTISYLGEYRTGFPFSVVDEEGALVGPANQRRLPSYFSLNVHFERRFRFLNYLLAWRAGMNNITDSSNPGVVNNNISSPDFLRYGRSDRRSVNVRLRFLGRR